jgi:hypothetical protein
VETGVFEDPYEGFPVLREFELGSSLEFSFCRGGKTYSARSSAECEGDASPTVNIS